MGLVLWSGGSASFYKNSEDNNCQLFKEDPCTMALVKTILPELESPKSLQLRGLS
jgi:hypothetical protein